MEDTKDDTKRAMGRGDALQKAGQVGHDAEEVPKNANTRSTCVY